MFFSLFLRVLKVIYFYNTTKRVIPIFFLMIFRILAPKESDRPIEEQPHVSR